MPSFEVDFAVSSTQYEYDHSLVGKRRFRLLTLLPDQTYMPIRISLEEYPTRVPISHLPEFRALSFAPEQHDLKNARISIGKTGLDISDRLEAALKNVRSPLQPQLFWVDQICIDQDDIGERNAHAKLVGKIYRAAKSVIAWLGPGDPSTTQTVKFASKMMAALELAEHVKPQRSRTLSGLRKLLQMAELDFKVPEADDPMWRAVMDLFSSPWFNKLLTIREAVISNHVTLRLGKTELKWTWLEKLLNYIIWTPALFKVLVTSNDSLIAYKSFLTLCILQDTANDGSHIPPWSFQVDQIPELLWKQDVIDPRDRVYGLLALAERDEYRRVKVDYGQPVEKVYYDYARMKMIDLDHIDLLRHTRLSPPRHDKSPSWVPDWEGLAVMHKNKEIAPLMNVSDFNAADDIEPEIRLSDNGRIMHTGAVFIGHLKSAGYTCESCDLEDTNVAVEPTHEGTLKDVRRVRAFLRNTAYLVTQAFSEHEAHSSRKNTSIVLAETLSREQPRSGHKRFDLDKAIDALGDFSILLRQLEPCLEYYATHKEHKPSWNWLFTKDRAVSDIVRKHFKTFYERYMVSQSATRRILDAWKSSYENQMVGQAVVLTDTKVLASVPHQRQEGDYIVVMYGWKTPFLVRLDEGGYCKVVGECYVNGMMRGEAIHDKRRVGGNLKLK